MFPIIDKKATGINLRRIMDARGIEVKDVQKYLNLGSAQSVYNWLNGFNMPTIDNLYALSDLLQVSIDEIVSGNRKALIPKLAVIKNIQDRRLYDYYKKLNKMLAS